MMAFIINSLLDSNIREQFTIIGIKQVNICVVVFFNHLSVP